MSLLLLLGLGKVCLNDFKQLYALTMQRPQTDVMLVVLQVSKVKKTDVYTPSSTIRNIPGFSVALCFIVSHAMSVLLWDKGSFGS